MVSIPSLLGPPRRLLAVAGTGLVVMFADTDAGSVITAAQSGAQWGYRLLLLQLLLVPVLYLVQELTVRLGVVTGSGHGELIRQRFGPGWAWLSVSTLAIACVGALVSELSGLAGVGLLYGVPRWASMVAVVGGLVTMVWTSSYQSIERAAIAFGAFELAFLVIAWAVHPGGEELVRGMSNVPLSDRSYLYLVTANIGAVIMPWMIFYQQSAVVEKRLDTRSLRALRMETAVGAMLTQAIMCGVLIATAATIGRTHPNMPLQTVQQISATLTPYLGEGLGRAVFACGIAGSAMVATIVVALTAAWGVGEVAGYRRSLTDHPREAPWFYGIFTLCLVLAGVLVACNGNLVSLSIGVQVMNALLLPIVLGFLFALANRTLPEAHRLKGVRALLVGSVMLVTAGFGVYAALQGIFA
jgi:NRAMP (natural resistance-associated macrophage protein)-like metal ion transporter